MAGWTHGICDVCWTLGYGPRPANRMAVMFRDDEKCIGCGRHTRSGIYLRMNPRVVKAHSAARYKDGVRGLMRKETYDT